jgi:hypothetical protein
MATKKKETALAKIADVALQDFAIAQFAPGEFAGLMKENFGDEKLSPRDLERVKIPAGGIKQWTVPSLDDEDGDMVKAIDGVVVAERKTRVFWQTEMGEGEGGTPPDCYSTDGKQGRGKPGHEPEGDDVERRFDKEGNATFDCIDCNTCPNNQWGSKEGSDGKACKEVTELYVLQKDRTLPIVMPLPPTSGQRFRAHKIGLLGVGKSVIDRLFTLTLDAPKNKKLITYSCAVVNSKPTAPDVAKAMREYAHDFAGLIGDMPPAAVQGEMDPGADAEK